MDNEDFLAFHAQVFEDFRINDDKEFETMEQEAIAKGHPPLAERIRLAHAKYDARIAARPE